MIKKIQDCNGMARVYIGDCLYDMLQMEYH